MATTVQQRSSLPVVPGAIPASSCTKLAIAVNCTQLAAAVWYVAPPVTFPVVYIRKRSGCVVANLLWLCVVSLCATVQSYNKSIIALPRVGQYGKIFSSLVLYCPSLRSVAYSGLLHTMLCYNMQKCCLL